MLSEDKSGEVEVNPLYHGGSSARVNQQELHGSTDDKNDEMNMDVGEMPPSAPSWSPSGVWWKDFLYFVGPGWFVSIAYVDPGNYQADIQAGATSRYSLLCIIWWTSVLSLYVQVLCVRLAHYGGFTLAEAQARHSSSQRMRYLNWFIAEISTIITDLPEVIGIGIAFNIFFNLPYWVGVVCSLFTTMIFLASLNYSTRFLEGAVAIFVGIMAIALFAEMDFVGFDGKALMEGWTIGVKDLSHDDLFSITGVVGAVVMPHNLYLHTAACQSRRVPQEHVEKAVFYSSIEPVLPVAISFFINLAVVVIAAESVYGKEEASTVGLTNFCDYFQAMASGCTLWGVALLAAGQSSAITTTYTGQYVMDGFLNLKLPVKTRAIMTRLVAILPPVMCSVLFPGQLNRMVNVVNAMLSFLLPFAFIPLVKYNCSEVIMGKYAAKGFEKYILYFFAFVVYLVNAIGLSADGGGFFGEVRENSGTFAGICLILVEFSVQLFYIWWIWTCLKTDITHGDQVETSNVELANTTNSSLVLGAEGLNGVESEII
mmetsp:Transcript_15014/g.22501  ORF Transcript_15014/g.22501 Transcript_15014/m.22501 type:complete len:541 (+) Transcript_15014:55-1677(+)